MYCESQEKAQSQTHFSGVFFRVLRMVKSTVDHILQVPSAEVVANRLYTHTQYDGRTHGDSPGVWTEHAL